ncbi:hypothetical protein ACIODW_23330 [Streptomyces sp. NPDC087897]|uniref:hypothetical protein n=1 Tax=Streptomyces sp. NPDC087897 TaxID=3365817 RepID=UPI0038092E1B
MTSNNMTGTEPVEPSGTAPSQAVDGRLIDELVGRAQAEGPQLGHAPRTAPANT